MARCLSACSWKAAAATYLDVGGQLLAQLQSEEGAVLTEQLLTEVAVAREALEKADAAYNTALDKLEVCTQQLMHCITTHCMTSKSACALVQSLVCQTFWVPK